MAGIAPLSGSASTSASSGIPGAPPSTAVSPTVKPPSSDAGNFTAFPGSYAGFGENGSSFGTVSVVDGKLSVVTSDSPANQPASTPSPAPPAEVPPAVVVPAAKTEAPVRDTPAPAPAPPTPQAGLQAPSLGQSSSNAPVEPAGQSQNTSTQGLIGSGSPAPAPGAPSSQGPAPTHTPEQGLLGAPPTNPIVIQAENQERAAAAAADEAVNQVAANQQADQIALQQINARIAAARAAGNGAAVAQLQPKQAAVVGDLQGQTFAGVGSTPPRPFARPEIPTVFLNIAS